MTNLFAPDRPFSIWMTRLFDSVLLSVLWLICCIPIVTIGPATQAVYYVALKQAEGEDGYVIQRFFHAFRRSFGKSVAVGLVMMGSGGLLVMDLWLSHLAGTNDFRMLILVFLVLLFLWASVFVYVFAVQARFENSVLGTVRTAAGLALQHIPQTLVLLVTALLPIALIPVVPILLLIVPGLIPMLSAKLLLIAFAPYLPPDPDDEEDTVEEDET